MGLLNRINDAINGRKRTTTQEIVSGLRVNALCSSFENLFPQVQAYIDEMDIVIPYGIGKNGAKLAPSRTPELVLLQNPNEEMGWYDFIDVALATWLTESELNIHVWKNQSGRKIEGFTILPPNCRYVEADGTNTFRVYSANNGNETLTSDEVMTMRFSRSPRNIDKGVSPASSVETYAELDDLMGQFQKAFFENGAVPATITVIRARSREQYEDTRKKMEKGYKGAENKNKTMFIWRQSLDDGSTADEVEVKTIQGNNSTLALKELNEIINDRLNKAFRVSEFTLGNDSSAKYDNAELSQSRFIEKCIYPALRRFWGQFQHELDRITGGLGYAISFDLEVPELTDRAKTRAETQEVKVRTLTSLITAGSTPSAAVKALELDKEWLRVADGIYQKSLQTEIATPLLADSHPKAEVGECSCCHHHDKVEVKDSLYQPVWKENEEAEKKIYEALMDLAEKIAGENPNIGEDEAKEIIDLILSGEADKGADVGAGRISGLVNEDQIRNEITDIIEGDGYHLSEEFNKKLQNRTSNLVERFVGDTKNIVEKVLTTGTEEGKTANQISDELSEALPRSRAEMIARNETVYAFKSGRLENDQFLAKKYGLKMKLIWRTSKDSNVCDVCKAMDGKVIELGQRFPDEGVTKNGVVVKWEQNSWNDEGRIPSPHCLCRCFFDEVVE